jgi:hypothetical protein
MADADAAPRLGGSRGLTFQPRRTIRIGEFSCPVVEDNTLPSSVEAPLTLLQAVHHHTDMGELALIDDISCSAQRATSPAPVRLTDPEQILFEQMAATPDSPAFVWPDHPARDDASFIGSHAGDLGTQGFICSAMGPDLSLLELPPRRSICCTNADSPRRRLCCTNADYNDTVCNLQRLEHDVRLGLDLYGLEGIAGSSHSPQLTVAPAAAITSPLNAVGETFQPSPRVGRGVEPPSQAEAPVDDSSTQQTDADPGMDFINSLLRPIPEALVHTPPRARGARCVPATVIPRRSDRLAGKSAFRDPNPEKQAKRVLVNKWERRPNDTPIVASDAHIADIFHDAFRGPIDSPTREAMRALLFPSPCERSNSALLTALVE